MLTDLIASYKTAKQVWEDQFAQDEDKASDSPEWDAYMDLSTAIIGYRCSEMAEIRDRALFILSDTNLVDILANSNTDKTVRSFLTSMVEPVDKSNNGEN